MRRSAPNRARPAHIWRTVMAGCRLGPGTVRTSRPARRPLQTVRRATARGSDHSAWPLASVHSGREDTPMRAARQVDPFTVLGLPASGRTVRRRGPGRMATDRRRHPPGPRRWRRRRPVRRGGRGLHCPADELRPYRGPGRPGPSRGIGPPARGPSPVAVGLSAGPGAAGGLPLDGERRRWRPAAGLLASRCWSRVRRGRPARLALRITVAGAVSLGVALIAGARPATPALITGVLTWLALTARHDLAPPG